MQCIFSRRDLNAEIGGYSSFESVDAPDICTVSGPSILQTATKVCCGDRIPKATGALEFVTSDIPRG